METMFKPRNIKTPRFCVNSAPVGTYKTLTFFLCSRVVDVEWDQKSTEGGPLTVVTLETGNSLLFIVDEKEEYIEYAQTSGWCTVNKHDDVAFVRGKILKGKEASEYNREQAFACEDRTAAENVVFSSANARPTKLPVPSASWKHSSDRT